MNRDETLQQLREDVLARAGESSVALGFDAPVPSRDRIEELNLAAHRAASGRYGLCIGCSRPIPLARLRAKPEAVRCIKCQEEHEKSPSARHTA